jgi:hypothetical protein
MPMRCVMGLSVTFFCAERQLLSTVRLAIRAVTRKGGTLAEKQESL